MKDQMRPIDVLIEKIRDIGPRGWAAQAFDADPGGNTSRYVALLMKPAYKPDRAEVVRWLELMAAESLKMAALQS